MNNKFPGFCFALTLAAVSSSSIAAIVPTSIERMFSYSYDRGNSTMPWTEYGPSTPGEFTGPCCSITNQYSLIGANEVIFDGTAQGGNSFLSMQFQITETKDYGLDWSIHHSLAPNYYSFACGGYSVWVTRNGGDASKVDSVNCSQTPPPGGDTVTGQTIIHFEAGDTGSLYILADSESYYYSVNVNAHLAEVNSVPVPASLPLLGSALASLLAIRKRRFTRTKK
jgi:hypothetical protein